MNRVEVEDGMGEGGGFIPSFKPQKGSQAVYWMGLQP